MPTKLLDTIRQTTAEETGIPSASTSLSEFTGASSREGGATHAVGLGFIARLIRLSTFCV